MVNPDTLQGKDIIDLGIAQGFLGKISVREGHAFRYYMVSNTYWTEWGGLIRETVFIDMKDNKVTNYGPVFNEVLFKYERLMCY